MKIYGKVWLTVTALALAALVMATLPSQPTRAAEPWYVGPGGSDGNACTSLATRCATINGAIAKASSGDEIRVAVGTYTGSGNEVVLLNKSATFSGGWNAGFTTQSGTSTIDGQGARRGMTVNSGVTATVERFVIQNGFVTVPGGGGIFNDGFLTLSNSSVITNTPNGGGGGIYNNGTLIVTNSIISNNSTVSGNGGGIYNTDILTLTNTTIDGNVSGGTGGGIFSVGGALTLSNSTVSGNMPYSSGGGIHNYSGIAILNNSTINGNISQGSGGGGGIVNRGTLTLDNSTVSGNKAKNGGIGGGIMNEPNANLTLNNSTIVDNMADSANGGIHNYSSYGGLVTLQNTILARNTRNNVEPWDCSGTVDSLGYNLIGNTFACTFIPTTGDLTNVDPKLGPLEGSPAYHPLLSGSPAINAGTPSGCMGSTGLLTADQRGAPRVGRCDIGAYEAGLAATKQVKGTFDPGGLVTYTITISNEEGITNLTNVFVTDTLPIYHTYVPGSFSATNGTGGESDGIITWSGTVFANTDTFISFGATLSDSIPQGIVVTNEAVISSGGVTITRQASFDTFARIYLPIIYTPCGNYFDDFSDPASGWSVGDFSNVRFEYLNGEYRILSKQSGFIFFPKAPTCQRENYVVETDARWAGTPGTAYGLVFGKGGPTFNFERYYLFDMNTNLRQFRLLRVEPSGTTTIVPPTFNPAINGGTASNHLKATRNGNQITLEVNGSVLGTWTDGTITGLTDVGVISIPGSNPTADVRFDNFSVTKLPGSSSTSIPGLSSTAIGTGNSQLSGADSVPMPADIPGWSSEGD